MTEPRLELLVTQLELLAGSGGASGYSSKIRCRGEGPPSSKIVVIVLSLQLLIPYTGVFAPNLNHLQLQKTNGTQASVNNEEPTHTGEFAPHLHPL